MQKVAIFGVPRSGTSWLGQILNSHPRVAFRYQPLFSYTHKAKLNERSSGEEIRSFYEEILNTDDQFVLMKSDFTKNYPIFPKIDPPTHIIFKETRYLNIINNLLVKCPEIKLIGIVRDPRSVLASWVCAPKEFKPEWKLSEEWRRAEKKNMGRKEEYFGFEKWKQSTLNFLELEKRHPDRFMLIKYIELKDKTNFILRNIFSFCNLQIEQQTLDFIKESKSKHDNDVNSVFRGKVNNKKWEEIIPGEIKDVITDQLININLNQFLDK